MYRVVTYHKKIPVGINFFNSLGGVGQMKKVITEAIEWPKGQLFDSVPISK